MKLCLTADWHLTDLPQDEHHWQIVERILQEAIQEHQVQEICVLGDVFQSREQFPEAIIAKARDLLLALEKPVHILAGNHDTSTSPQKYPTETPLQDLAHDRIQVYQEITENSHGLWIPFAKLEGIHRTIQQPVVFAHDLVSGAELGMYAPVILEDLQILKHFSKVQRVFAGHIHLPQSLHPLHAPQTQWTYIGSPYSIGYKQIDKPRYILYDTHTGDMQSIPIQP